MSVELPKDAEGREIPLDTEVLYDKDGNPHEVARFTYSVNRSDDKWDVVFTTTIYKNTSMTFLKPPEPPDSWERLEADIESFSHREDVCCYFGHGNDIGCDVCPASSTTTPCTTCVLQDVMRRAKSLAGRGEN